MVYLYVNSKNRTARKRLPDRAATNRGRKFVTVLLNLPKS